MSEGDDKLAKAAAAFLEASGVKEAIEAQCVDVWNAAIEAAARLVESVRDDVGGLRTGRVAEMVRGLKEDPKLAARAGAPHAGEEESRTP